MMAAHAREGEEEEEIAAPLHAPQHSRVARPLREYQLLAPKAAERHSRVGVVAPFFSPRLRMGRRMRILRRGLGRHRHRRARVRVRRREEQRAPPPRLHADDDDAAGLVAAAAAAAVVTTCRPALRPRGVHLGRATGDRWHVVQIPG